MRPRSKELAPAKWALLASARGSETPASARQKRRALVTAALGDGPGPSGGGRPSQEEAFALAPTQQAFRPSLKRCSVSGFSRNPSG